MKEFLKSSVIGRKLNLCIRSEEMAEKVQALTATDPNNANPPVTGWSCDGGNGLKVCVTHRAKRQQQGGQGKGPDLEQSAALSLVKF